VQSRSVGKRIRASTILPVGLSTGWVIYRLGYLPAGSYNERSHEAHTPSSSANWRHFTGRRRCCNHRRPRPDCLGAILLVLSPWASSRSSTASEWSPSWVVPSCLLKWSKPWRKPPRYFYPRCLNWKKKVGARIAELFAGAGCHGNVRRGIGNRRGGLRPACRRAIRPGFVNCRHARASASK